MVQWIELLVPFLSGKAELVGKFEVVRRNIDEPLGINGANFPHVLLGSEDQLVVDDPLRLLVEEGTTGVNVHLVTVNESAIPSFVVFPGSVEKKSRNYRLSNERVVLATGFDRQFALF